MRFVHSLAKLEAHGRCGWFAPVELGEDAPHDISFVIPMDIRADERYECEIVLMGRAGGRVVSCELLAHGVDSFLLRIGDRELRFSVASSGERRIQLPYIGRLSHPDFSSSLVEIVPEDPGQLDDLCDREKIVVVGCDPFTRYAGAEPLVTGPAR